MEEFGILPTLLEVEGSSDHPPTVVEVKDTPSPCTLGDLGPAPVVVEDVSGDPHKHSHTSPTPAEIEKSSDNPPPYCGGVSIVCVPAAVEIRPFKSYGCYLSVVIVLMCLSLLLVNPVAFMLVVGALVHVLVYRRKV